MAIYNPFQRFISYPEQEPAKKKSLIYIPLPSSNRGHYVQHVTLSAKDAVAAGWRFTCKTNGRLRITHYRGTDKNITVPYQIGERIVNELGNGAFRRTDISTVMIPDSIKKIRENCFRESNVRKIFFHSGGNAFAPGLRDIPGWFAWACRNLEEVVLPSTVHSIGTRAFSCCNKLKFISLPYFCRTVAPCAFASSGLEGFAFARSSSFLQTDFDGTALQDTPLDQNYGLILLADPKECKTFQIALVARLAHNINIPSEQVYFSPNSFLARKQWLQNVNLSRCKNILGLNRAFQYSHGFDDDTKFQANGATFNFILPESAVGVYIPQILRAYNPDSSRYDRYLSVEHAAEGSAGLYLHGNTLVSYSVRRLEREVSIRADRAISFENRAVCSRSIRRLSLSDININRWTEAELFAPCCDSIEYVRWGENEVFLPPLEEFGWREHKELLTAFRICIADNTPGKPARRKFFDSTVIDRMFSRKNRCEKKNTVYWELPQRAKLMLAVDVMRSTAELFPNRAMYADYLRTHRSYAGRLCKKHKLPAEYEELLRKYYEVEK